jgi:hypothetical protein
LQAAIEKSPIELAENVRIIVEERKKSAKTEAKMAKQFILDRRLGNKTEEGRNVPSQKKTTRTGPGGPHKRTE